MLANNTYFFASPKEFNDPLDCAWEPTYELPPVKKIIENQVLILQDTCGMDSDEALRRSQPLRQLNEEQLNELFDKTREEVKHILLTEYGILSLSEKNDHILMWSHYADHHKGFCIEFKRTENNPLSTARPVEYFEVYPNFSYFDDLPGEIAIKTIFTKASVWRYEFEWRGVQKANTEVSYTDDMITGIIFGLRMSAAHKKQIRDALKRYKSIEFYQAELVPRKFKLKITQIP